MAQQCLEFSEAVLHYEKLGAKAIHVYIYDEYNPSGTTGSHNVGYYASGENELITWEWEELINYRRWLLEGTFTSAIDPNCGSVYPWSKTVNLEHSDIDIITLPNNRVIWINNKTYPNSPHLYSKHRLTSEAPHGGLIIKYHQCASENSHITSELVLDISLNSVSPAPFFNTRWKLKIYNSGVEIATHEFLGDMSNPPEERITIPGEIGFIPTTINFSKLPDTEAFELITVSVEDDEYQIIKHFLDENSNSINQEIFYNIFGKNPELYCVTEGECPENSCTVDCGTYCCCYNSQGYSVHAFSKQEGGN